MFSTTKAPRAKSNWTREATPLKLFEVEPDDLERLTDESWKPQLYLTKEERSIVQTKGTVLVLGRSGTGKTVCIGNRMSYDYQSFGSDPSFSQLFVARSQKLCNFVKASIEEYPNSDFQTFGQLLRVLEASLPQTEKPRALFLPSMKMDFSKFKQDVYSVSGSNEKVDALIVWSHIRSFVKGSIDAQQRPEKRLSEADYLALGKRRCRLSPKQREFVYKSFERYDRYMKEYGFWDEMDRATSLVERLENAREITAPEFVSVRRRKIYVDEVQDYTQAEIYIFFLLNGPGDL